MWGGGGGLCTSITKASNRLAEETSHAPAGFGENVAEVGLRQLPGLQQLALGVFQWQMAVKALHRLLQTILLPHTTA